MREQIEISPRHSSLNPGAWLAPTRLTESVSTPPATRPLAPAASWPAFAPWSASSAWPPPQGDTDSGDWDMLFRAVIARMRHSLVTPDGAEKPQSSLDEGLHALENLQAMLEQERVCTAQIKSEIATARATLDATHAALNSSREGERRALHLATHDKLTSLPNRCAFDERLDKALALLGRRGPSLALFFLDLDGFKPINDSHGHAVGDELLRIVAARLVGAVRSTDLVCRIGGDEFACLVSEPLAREQLSRLAQQLFDAVSSPVKIGPLQLSVRPSIGIARCPTDGDTPAALLMNADTAMYRAKRRQLGHAFFDRRSDR